MSGLQLHYCLKKGMGWGLSAASTTLVADKLWNFNLTCLKFY